MSIESSLSTISIQMSGSRDTLHDLLRRLGVVPEEEPKVPGSSTIPAPTFSPTISQYVADIDLLSTQIMSKADEIRNFLFDNKDR